MSIPLWLLPNANSTWEWLPHHTVLNVVGRDNYRIYYRVAGHFRSMSAEIWLMFEELNALRKIEINV